jgi:hypothetical protein
MLLEDASSTRALSYLSMGLRGNDRYESCVKVGEVRTEARLMSYLDSMLIDLTMKTKIEYRLFPHLKVPDRLV